MQTTILIVTPSFNAADTIERTILSVVTQAGDFSLLYHVQDGGSTDNTVGVLKHWEKMVADKTLPLFCQSVTFSYASGKDKGLYDAIAKGFDRPVSPDAWLGWINADDLLLPGTCALLASIDATPSQRHMKWIGGTSGVVKNEVVIANEQRALGSDVIKEGLCEGQHWGFVQQEGVFFRNRVWRSIDIGREFRRFKYAGDWNLWRVMAHKYRFFQANRPLGLFRVRDGQISQQNRTEYEDEISAVLPAGKRLMGLKKLARTPPERSVLSYAWPSGEVGFMTESLAAEAQGWLERRIGPRHNADWQFPAVTERHACEAVWSSFPTSDDMIYFAFPWATLIDQIHNRVDSTKLMAELKSAARRKRPAARIVTVCQHVRMPAYRDLFEIAGVTDIFWSHTTKGNRVWPGSRAIALYPFPLFPVQLPKAIPFKDDEARPHLFSFVGAAANTWYLSEARSWIINELADDPRGIVIGRTDWHYDKIVYDHQIRKVEVSTDKLVNQDASEEFRRLLCNSTFALCPSGSGPNSIRLWESIGAGSIPVILADTYATPGHRALWAAACVFCAEEIEAVRALPDQLAAIAADPKLLAQKRQALRQLWALYGPDNFINDLRVVAFKASSESLAAAAKPAASARRLKVGLIGRHSSRTPMSYAAYAPFFRNEIEIVRNLETAEVIVSGFDIDFRENIEQLGRIKAKNPAVKFAIISEEPLWDTVWAVGFREKMVRVADKGVTIDYGVINHVTSKVFDFAAIPYFLTTNDDYLARYSYYLTRNAAMTPEAVLELWRTVEIPAAFYSEKREDPRYKKAFPDLGIAGLSLYRSDVAAGVDLPGMVRVGQGWGEQAKRQALPDWHLDKLVALDGRAFIVSAIENTHQRHYVTEKMFDAFCVQGLPLYYADKDHAIHRLVKGGFVNIFGKTPAEVVQTIHQMTPTLQDATAWCAAQQDLAGLLSDPMLLAQERKRIARQAIDALKQVVAGRWTSDTATAPAQVAAPPQVLASPQVAAPAAKAADKAPKASPTPPSPAASTPAVPPKAAAKTPDPAPVSPIPKAASGEPTVSAKAPAKAPEPAVPAKAAAKAPQPALAAKSPARPFSAKVVWEQCTGLGDAEGPFPQWEMHKPVRWVIDRKTSLTFQASERANVCIRFRYLCRLIDQVVQVSVNGTAVSVLRLPQISDFRESDVVAVFGEGENVVDLNFSDAVDDPDGSGRKLAMLLEDATIVPVTVKAMA